jgi:precorrin-2 dehydrogenase/sirohydrochlorin ferrochelatase
MSYIFVLEGEPIMLPLVLDLARLRAVLIGDGDAVLRRLRLLDEAGAGDLAVYCADPSPELQALAAARLQVRLPHAADLIDARIVFLAGLAAGQQREFAALARQAGALLHAEDAKDLTDFHAPAVLRRGDLTIAISTSGKAPALAAALKRRLGELIGPEWRGRVGELANLRRRWRQRGAAMPAVARAMNAKIEGSFWLAGLRPEPRRTVRR